MKKSLLKTLIVLGMVYSSNLLAVIPDEYQEIVDSFKLKDTSKKELSKTYKINGEKITATLEKQDDGNFQEVQHIITIYKPYKTTLGEPQYWHSIGKYDQKLLSVACIGPDKKTILASVGRSSFENKKIQAQYVSYAGFVAKIDKNTCCGNYDIDGGLFDEKHSAGFETSIPTYNPQKFFPYYNEQKILARLYETGTCSQDATQKANIQVLVNGKWIPQEQSWTPQNSSNVISNTNTPTNQLTIQQKQPLYKSPTEASITKMYLIAGDKVERIEEKDEWLHIIYHGKKDIDAWIPKEAVK